MARFKLSVLFFLSFSLLAANTFYRFDIASRPLHALQGLIDAAMADWLGDSVTALVLAALAVGIPILTMRKSYEPKAQMALDSAEAALQGRVHRPAQSNPTALKDRINNTAQPKPAAQKRNTFGRRS